MRQHSIQDRPRAVRRLSPEARRRQIVLAAIELITEQGLNFNTRELAQRISVSHPLLFRYFASKDDILDGVYQEVFAGRYSEELRTILNESASDQIEKWTRFYTQYFPRIHEETWIRIFVASAFSSGGLSRRYLRNIVTPLVDRLAADTETHVFGSPVDDAELRNRSRELAWMLHSSMFYTGVRRWIFQLSVPKDVSIHVPDKVLAHFAGAAAVLKLPSGP